MVSWGGSGWGGGGKVLSNGEPEKRGPLLATTTVRRGKQAEQMGDVKCKTGRRRRTENTGISREIEGKK